MVGRRFSANCCSVQPPATMIHCPGRAARAAAAMRPIASGIEWVPIQLTSVA